MSLYRLFSLILTFLFLSLTLPAMAQTEPIQLPKELQLGMTLNNELASAELTLTAGKTDLQTIVLSTGPLASEAGGARVGLTLDPEQVPSLAAGSSVTVTIKVDSQPAEVGTYTGTISVTYASLPEGVEPPTVPVTLTVAEADEQGSELRAETQDCDALPAAMLPMIAVKAKPEADPGEELVFILSTDAAEVELPLFLNQAQGAETVLQDVKLLTRIADSAGRPVAGANSELRVDGSTVTTVTVPVPAGQLPAVLKLTGLPTKGDLDVTLAAENCRRVKDIAVLKLQRADSPKLTIIESNSDNDINITAGISPFQTTLHIVNESAVTVTGTEIRLGPLIGPDGSETHPTWRVAGQSPGDTGVVTVEEIPALGEVALNIEVDAFLNGDYKGALSLVYGATRLPYKLTLTRNVSDVLSIYGSEARKLVRTRETDKFSETFQILNSVARPVDGLVVRVTALTGEDGSQVEPIWRLKNLGAGKGGPIRVPFLDTIPLMLEADLPRVGKYTGTVTLQYEDHLQDFTLEVTRKMLATNPLTIGEIEMVRKTILPWTILSWMSDNEVPLRVRLENSIGPAATVSQVTLGQLYRIDGENKVDATGEVTGTIDEAKSPAQLPFEVVAGETKNDLRLTIKGLKSTGVYEGQINVNVDNAAMANKTFKLALRAPLWFALVIIALGVFSAWGLRTWLQQTAPRLEVQRQAALLLRDVAWLEQRNTDLIQEEKDLLDAIRSHLWKEYLPGERDTNLSFWKRLRARWDVQRLGSDTTAKTALTHIDTLLSLIPKMVQARRRIDALEPKDAFKGLCDKLHEIRQKLSGNIGKDPKDDGAELQTLLDAGIKDARSAVLERQITKFQEDVEGYEPTLDPVKTNLEKAKNALVDAATKAKAGELELATSLYDSARKTYAHSVALDLMAKLETPPEEVHTDAWPTVKKEIQAQLQPALHPKDNSSADELMASLDASFDRYLEVALNGLLIAVDNRIASEQNGNLKQAYQKIQSVLDKTKAERGERQWDDASKNYTQAVKMYRLAQQIADRMGQVQRKQAEITEKLHNNQGRKLLLAVQRTLEEVAKQMNEAAKQLPTNIEQAEQVRVSADDVYVLTNQILELADRVQQSLTDVNSKLKDDPDNTELQQVKQPLENVGKQMETAANQLAEGDTQEAKKNYQNANKEYNKILKEHRYTVGSITLSSVPTQDSTVQPIRLPALPIAVRETTSETPATRLRRIQTLIDRYAGMQNLINSASLVIALLVSIVIGILLLYLPNTTWGSMEDIILALLWGFGLHTVTNASAVGAFATFSGPQQVLNQFNPPATGGTPGVGE